MIEKQVTTSGNFSISHYQDLALVESVKRGNQAAFTLLFKKYHPYLCRKIFLSIRNKQEAEDITSELFQMVYEKIGQYEKNYTFNAWLTKVAQNYMIDRIRKQNRDRVRLNSFSIDAPVPQDDPNEEAGFQISSGEPEAMIASESIERVAQLKVTYAAIEKLPYMAIECLPELTLRIFNMFQKEGKTPIEIVTLINSEVINGILQKELKTLSSFTARIFEEFQLDKTEEEIASQFKMEISEVKAHIKKGVDKYQKALYEQDILNLIVLRNTSIEDVSRKLKFDVEYINEVVLKYQNKIIDLITVDEHIKKGFQKFDQGALEQRILELYLMENLPYEKIANKVKVNLNTVKVMIMRAKSKLINAIDQRKAAIEVAGIYAIEQINVSEMYKLNIESN